MTVLGSKNFELTLDGRMLLTREQYLGHDIDANQDGSRVTLRLGAWQDGAPVYHAAAELSEAGFAVVIDVVEQVSPRDLRA